MDRAQWRAELRDRRVAWRTPRIDTLQRPALSMARRIGLLTLRAYIVFAIVIMVIKLVQVTVPHSALAAVIYGTHPCQSGQNFPLDGARPLARGTRTKSP
jgi:hypothetical protein